ncbi:DUF4194 domain-containing protein [Chitinibacter sp. SCUT-21]|uniref:condensin complex protein MksE n=1 Tax=Chitinibacter sp. SCUT-21 TaxID=2970891 RepID=UPI0035A64960
MFEHTVRLLLEGVFICEITHHEAFAFLNHPANQQAVNDYLGKIGLRLASTAHGGAFFAAHIETGGPEKKAAKEVFTKIKHELRPLVAFLELVMRASQKDDVICAGSVIETASLMLSIDSNPTLRSDLQSLANLVKGPAADSSDRARFNKVLNRFKDEGYLFLANSEREIYQVTGKIEFIMEAIAFLSEHEKIGLEDEEAEVTSQGSLL